MAASAHSGASAKRMILHITGVPLLNFREKLIFRMFVFICIFVALDFEENFILREQYCNVCLSAQLPVALYLSSQC